MTERALHAPGERRRESFFIFLHVLFHRNPLRILALLIVLIPFSGAALFEENLLPVPGSKPIIIVAIVEFLVLLYMSRKSARLSSDIVRFTAVYLLFFSAAVFRISDSSFTISELMGGPASRVNFLLSFYIKPFIYFVPFLITAAYIRSREEFEYALDMVTTAVLALSVFLLYHYVFSVSDRLNYEAVRLQLGETLNLHGNDIVNLYMVTFPLFMARVFRRRTAPTVAAIVLSLVIIAILYSRTAYAVILITLVTYLSLTRRWGALLWIGALFAILVPVTAVTVIERASRGLSGDGVNLEALLAGRLGMIWGPLVREYFSDPATLLFGVGRYGIVASDAFRSGRILPVQHPHNLYLELIIDVGLVGAVLILGSFFRILARSIRRYRRFGARTPLNEYRLALLLSVFGFLIAGLSGRSFFPRLQNSYFWLMAGLLVSLRNLEPEGTAHVPLPSEGER